VRSLFAILILLCCSVYLRMEDKVRRAGYQFPEQAKASPLSEALQELLAHAGGIYLSLILLISFLHIDLAEEWRIMGINMEPVAFSSLALAGLWVLTWSR